MMIGKATAPRLVVVSCISVLLLPAIAASSDQRPPNVLLIFVDDLGYGDLSSYGADDLQSPHVDALAASGMKFNNFYANCPVCSPSRASLLTGRYPELVGVPGVIRTHPQNNWGYLDPECVMLPELLKKVGYRTAIIGKWHLGLESPSEPGDRGFDYFHGYLGDMMDDYYKHRRHNINYMRHNRDEIDPKGHATDLFTQWACQYIEKQSNEEKPFFLYLAYNAPHTPIQPPPQWVAKVKERQPGIGEARAKLVALIEHMDDGIGKVVRSLDKAGLRDETLIIFSSDNGGQLNVGANNGLTRDGKQSMYEGGLRVPTCVSWPGTVKPGSKSDAIGITMDLFATICDVADVSSDQKVDGISLLPTLKGQSQDTASRDLFFHRREGGARYEGLTIQAVRRGDWKLLKNSPFQPLELYNLANDPLEENDLRQKAPMKYRQLAEALRVQLQRGGAVPWQKPARKND